MANYDDIDLAFSWNGDFSRGHTGDIEDTSEDGLRSFREQLHDIVASSLGDWEIYPRRGANVSDSVGEPNTEQTADALHDRIRIALVSANIVREEDLSIRIVPVHRNRVLVVLKVNATPTPLNKLESGQGIVVQFVFDYFEQGINYFQ